jgi:hypothetical protein
MPSIEDEEAIAKQGTAGRSLLTLGFSKND